MRILRLFAIVLSFAAIASSPVAAEPIGNTVQASTSVSAKGTAGSRILQKSSPLFFNDLLKTNATGIGQFIFDDGAKLAMGPSAQVVIDKNIYKGGKSLTQASIQATKGAFRYISGSTSGHKIATPYGTIGIRGTAFDFTIQNGKVYILLFRGNVDFCTRGSCKTLTRGCDYLVAGGGGISTPKRLGSGGKKTDVDIDTIFPLLVNQDKLNSKFRGGSGCDSRQAQRKADRRNSADRLAPQPSPAVASVRTVRTRGPDGRGGGGDNGPGGQDSGGGGGD
ncbi:hypothetical protein G5V57_14340 [Nordella sp. HKS 07]|uniref:FecR family protein n=1 Tax=Nordella sp. HKS 07 TaxID=2712222 RepID=UPI0013E1D578|nr:FecR domain-containing protein [Nordella sp. HKS 07]QIG48803.1 hypothetical protein G5V57_14340 [Nordella sp. HKS 07]